MREERIIEIGGWNLGPEEGDENKITWEGIGCWK